MWQATVASDKEFIVLITMITYACDKWSGIQFQTLHSTTYSQQMAYVIQNMKQLPFK